MAKYDFVDRDIEEDDPELRILYDLQVYADRHINFKTGFIDSIEKLIEKRGCISPAQYNALVNMFYRIYPGEPSC